MRLSDWRQRLISYLHAARKKPFVYGQHDCTLFAADAVQAMTGADHGAKYRGKYKTLSGGLRLLKKSGFEDNIAFVASILTECPAIMAQPGDVAVIDAPDGPALGIVQGESVYAVSQSGLALVPLTAARRAFRV